MAEPSDPSPPPDPPLAHRAEFDSAEDSAYDSGYDSRFDSAEADRRAELELKRRQRTVLLIVLLATFLPIAGCGFLFAVCTAFSL